VYGLGESGPAVVEMADRLRTVRDTDSDKEVRQMAAWAFRAVSGRAMVADPNMILLEGIRGNSQERFDAVRRLGVTATSSRVAIRELISLLGDTIPSVRAQAVESLIEVGPAALPSLSAALGHRNRAVRKGALIVLSRLQRSF
jgi:HEAT repeat protein